MPAVLLFWYPDYVEQNLFNKSEYSDRASTIMILQKNIFEKHIISIIIIIIIVIIIIITNIIIIGPTMVAIVLLVL